MSAEYKQGYADGVSDLRNKLMVQIHDVLQQEKFHSKSLSKSTDLGQISNNQGWIECLKMFQHQLTGKEL